MRLKPVRQPPEEKLARSQSNENRDDEAGIEGPKDNEISKVSCNSFGDAYVHDGQHQRVRYACLDDDEGCSRQVVG